MARPKSQHPTELELEILKILWRDDEANVRHVRDALAPFRDLAYTSVMTTMGTMEQKGYLRRRRDGKSYLYSPRVTAEATSRGMLGDLLARVFDGSPKALMLNLIESGEIDESELEDLQRTIDQRVITDREKGGRGDEK